MYIQCWYTERMYIVYILPVRFTCKIKNHHKIFNKKNKTKIPYKAWYYDHSLGIKLRNICSSRLIVIIKVLVLNFHEICSAGRYTINNQSIIKFKHPDTWRLVHVDSTPQLNRLTYLNLVMILTIHITYGILANLLETGSIHEITGNIVKAATPDTANTTSRLI